MTEKNISHVSGATIQFFDSGLIKYDRIDYLKYICEEKDYYYHKNENNDIVLIGPSEDVIFEYVDENNQPIIGDYLKVSDMDYHIIDYWKSDGKQHVIKNLNVGQKYIFERIDDSANKIEYRVKSKLEFKQKVVLQI